MADPLAPSPIDAGPTLALALIESSHVATLLLDQSLTVVAASGSFLRAFKLKEDEVVGREARSIGSGEWGAPQLGSLLRATASGAAEIDAYEMDLKRPDGPVRRLVLNARKIEYGVAPVPTRILLTVVDVTAERGIEQLKDQLLRDKAIALQEVQHRVANSLQIIASVILQSARRVQSEESCGHLRDAHNRVMSVAALQKQLATSQVGDVELRPYFAQLCDSLGASMIQDHDKVVLEVDVDDSVIDADVSVSLGLLVTELVINSLKHAFPGGRRGRIVVGYKSEPSGWTLSVRDDGVGMRPTEKRAKAGLGTSIVQALAKQLLSVVEVVDQAPGTRVSITHTNADGLSAPRAV